MEWTPSSASAPWEALGRKYAKHFVVPDSCSTDPGLRRSPSSAGSGGSRLFGDPFVPGSGGFSSGRREDGGHGAFRGTLVVMEVPVSHRAESLFYRSIGASSLE
jgi:hypothetical protein